MGSSLPLRLVCEALGTGAIAYVARCAPLLASGPLAQALLIGLTVATLIHAFGRTSGAHFNPAVSLVLMLQQGGSRLELLAYSLAQLAGAVAATLALAPAVPAVAVPAVAVPAAGVPAAGTVPVALPFSATAFGPELVFTAALLGLIVVWAREGKLCPFSQPLSGVVIGAGLTVFVALAGLQGSGVLNPALSVAQALGQGPDRLPAQLLAQGLAALLVLAAVGRRGRSGERPR